MKNKIAFLVFFGLGLLGVLSLLFVNTEALLPNEAKKQIENIPTLLFRFSTLITPIILLIIFTLIGTLTYKKVNLSAPSIEAFIMNHNWKPLFLTQFKFGGVSGVIVGLLLVLVTFLFQDYLPRAFLELQQKFELPIITKLLYGGITEEILMRFGLMSLLVFLSSFIFKLKPISYIIAIVIASSIFAVGHFPVVYLLMKEPTTLLLTYIFLGNFIGGVIFGWLYWKKGLEAAIMAHVFTHLSVITLTIIL